MESILQLSNNEWESIIDEALAIHLIKLKDKDTPANPSANGEDGEDDRSTLVSGPPS